jgi:hypothetical protein
MLRVLVEREKNIAKLTFSKGDSTTGSGPHKIKSNKKSVNTSHKLWGYGE